MKNNKKTIISTVAASAILVSVFAFNSNAEQINRNTVDTSKPVEASVSAVKTNATLTPAAQAVATALETLRTDSSAVAPKVVKLGTSVPTSTSVPNSKYCPKNVNSNVSSANQNTGTVKSTNNQQTANTSLKTKLEEILKSYTGSLSAKLFSNSNSNKQCSNSPAKNTITKPAASPAKPSGASKPAAAKPSSTTSKPTAGTTTKPSAGTTSGEYSAFQKKVVELVNAERAKAGLKPLKMNTELSRVATLKSQDMAKNNYFDHNSPTYGSPFDMMKKFGISYRTAGENIAMGQTSPEQVMNGWMNSPGHRANILKSSFTEIGVGIAKNSSGRLYWTQQFIG